MRYSTWSWRRTQKIFVHTRLLISLRVSFCRNKDQEEKQKFSTATMVRFARKLHCWTPFWTILPLFCGKFSHDLVDNSPTEMRTVPPWKWHFSRKYTIFMVNLDLTHKHSIDHLQISSIANPYNASWLFAPSAQKGMGREWMPPINSVELSSAMNSSSDNQYDESQRTPYIEGCNEILIQCLHDPWTNVMNWTLHLALSRVLQSWQA